MAFLRILTVDDQEAFRRGVRALLSSRSDWLICGEAEDGIQAVESARALRPDVVVMDVSMPRMNGLEATQAIRRELPEAKVIIISQNDPRVVRQQAAKVQAHGYVGKADLSLELVPTIERVLELNADAEHPLLIEDSVSAPSSSGSTGMAALIAQKNWAETPIGAAETWSPTLRTITNFMLANRFPLLLWWGPEYIQMYNDAYAPILGVKHPNRALGRPVRECWNEIWHVLKPLIDTPFHGGPATWMEDIELEINRSGRIEETHFTVAYSAVPDETAPTGIGGVLATVHEITEKIVGERRVAILRDLGAGAGEAKTAEQACSIAAEVLGRYPKDFPFALLYLNDAEGRQTRLVSCTHSAQEGPGAPAVMELETNCSADEIWPLAQVMQTLGTVITSGLEDGFEGKVPRGVWSEPPSQAAVVPIRSSHAGHLAGFLIAGISAGLRCDGAYLSFLDLAARQIATSIANARAYEEERQRAEALAEIDRAKTAFFSNVSHEFRTPLTLMLGPLHDLLAKSQTHLSPTAKDQLELVNRNGARLLRLVNTLLDFSRIEAGRIEAVYQATDLAAFTGELASVFRSATDRAGLQLLVDCRALGEPVYIDREMWEKVVLNLLSNAFKFTFEGEIEVSVGRVGDAAELRVRDTGVGIPQEAIPKLFDRFHRVANTRSRTHEGSGIGLALVQELVKLHGGSIDVASTVGRGTSFIVRIPFGQNHLTAGKIGGSRSSSSTGVGATPFVEEALRWLPDEPTHSEELFESVEFLPVPCPPASDSADRSRILVADDNADMRQYLARLLAEHYEVETVADGQIAINAARQRPPNLILSDVMMPVLDGFDLLKAIRADERTRSIPVVLLSARAGEESRVEGLQAGADDYLIKPFSSRELLARISARLEIAQLQRENEQRVTTDLMAMTRLLDIGNRCVRAGNEFDECLDEIVAAAIELTGANKGTLQLLDPASGVLTIRAQRGFDEPFLRFFAAVEHDSSACGATLESLRRVIVEDVRSSDILKGQATLDVMLQAGIRAIQSTPVVSSTGDVLGMISTHFSRPHRLNERELRLIDLLARQAGDYLERKRSEDALGKSEERFRAFVTASSDVVYRMSPDWKEMKQLQGRDFIGDTDQPSQTWLETYIHADDREQVMAAIEKAVRTKSTFESEHRVVRVDGTLGWTFSRAVPLLDSQGELVEWFGTATDISERRRAEEALRELADSLETQVRVRTQELESRTVESMKQSEDIRNLSAHILKIQDDERRRIAREFHDSAGQTLTALGLNIAELVQRAEIIAPKLAKPGKEIEGLVQQLHREIRTTSYLLHPPLLDEAGLKSALSWYAQGVAERSGIEIDLSIPDDFGRLPADIELVMFRVVQECLTNIHRHSGSKTANIQVFREGDGVCLEVRDQGKGIPPDRLIEVQSQGSGVGIRGMRERLVPFHGDMNIESSVAGTSFFVKIPIPKLARSADVEPLETVV
jgi:signal transduction histidine kinase/CheY-like chemotaxis protein